MIKKGIAAIAMPFVVLVAASCGGSSPVIRGEAQDALPRATLENWATYGDKLVVVKAIAESEDTLSAEEKERGEGYISRTVTFQIGSGKWTRPGAKRRMPTTIDVANGGWVVHGQDRQEMQLEGYTKAEVGKSYVALFTYSDVTAIVDPETRKVTPGEGASWTLLDLVPLRNNTIASPSQEDATRFPARASIARLSPEAAGQKLQSTKPEQAAAKYMDLDPVVRYQDVQLDRAEQTPPTPGEGEKK